jgi:hypothetical protein
VEFTEPLRKSLQADPLGCQNLPILTSSLFKELPFWGVSKEAREREATVCGKESREGKERRRVFLPSDSAKQMLFN